MARRFTDSEKAKRHYDKKIALVREWKSQGCRRCGEKRVAALDAHHRDPSTKHESLRRHLTKGGKWVSCGWRSLPLSDIPTELDKCDVLCANCHRIEVWESKH